MARRAADLEAELQFVKAHELPVSGHQWHLVSTAWLQAWREHVTKAGPNPGPICNSQLLDPNKRFQAPMPGLVAEEHYRGVSIAVWTLFQKRYGGGPNITCPVLDIYRARIHAPSVSFSRDIAVVERPAGQFDDAADWLEQSTSSSSVLASVTSSTSTAASAASLKSALKKRESQSPPPSSGNAAKDSSFPLSSKSKGTAKQGSISSKITNTFAGLWSKTSSLAPRFGSTTVEL